MTYGDGTELHKLELAMEAAEVAWWWMELPSGAVFFSPNKARMLGYDPEKFLHYTDFTSLVHDDDYKPMMKAMQNHLDDKTPEYKITYRIKDVNGHYRKFLDKGRIVSKKPDGEIVVAGIVLDIKDDSGQT